MNDFLEPYRITWIVIGVILAVKGIAALIYFCCCRRPHRSNTSRPQPLQFEVPENGQFPNQVDAPPSYDDLMKNGILNTAYTCEANNGSTAGPSVAPPVLPSTTGLPPPPPYCVTPNECPPQPLPSQPSGANTEAS